MMPNRWVILGVLFLARTAMGFQFQSIASVSPLLINELQLDFALLGTLIGVWMLPGIFVAIPGALIGRRFGDKKIVIIGLVLMVAGSLCTASAHGYGLAVTGRIVSGTGAVLINVLVTKMVADWFASADLGTAMGILTGSWPLGIGLALVLLGPLAVSSSWSTAMDVTAWVCALALLCVAVIYRQPEVAIRSESSKATSWHIDRRELMAITLAGLTWLFYNVAYILVVSFAPALLVEQGYTPAGAAIVASFATWPLIATVPIGGVLADRTGRGHAITLLSLLGMTVMLPLMLAVPSPLVVLAIVALLTGLPAGIIMGLPARTLHPQSRHLGMGIFFTIYYLGMALLPGVGGWFRDETGVRGAPLFFGSVLLVLALICEVLFRRLERRASV